MKAKIQFYISAACFLLAVLPIYDVASAATVTFDTTPYWPLVYGIVGGFGSDGVSTVGETFVAPAGGSVALNNFTFYGQSYWPLNGGVANLHLQAFVFQWSGNGATGNPIYLSSTFIYSPPPSGWTPLTANLGATGVSLIPNGVYVMGFTLSNPANWAASSGDVEFQNIPGVTIPASASGGGAEWNQNSGNNFSALTNSSWGGGAPLSFTANLTVVPECSGISLITLGSLLWFTGRRILQGRRRTPLNHE